MTPKLYLIESEEKNGLVKIGFTGSGDNTAEDDVVYNRIQQYRAGMSHSSTVYETLGAPIFERYFHRLVSQKQKQIKIKFKLTGKVSQPREWFELPLNISEALVAAFSKKHPTNIDELSIDDLPIFLSGALSAIHWHAQNITASELAELTIREELLSDFEDIETRQIEYWLRQGQEQIHSSQDLPVEQLDKTQIEQYEDDLILGQEQIHTTMGSPTEQESYSIPSRLIQSLSQAERLRVEMKEMREMESSRTIIALLTAAMIFFQLITGATVAGCLFAILASLLYASWPSVQPIGATALVDLSNRLKSSARKSRHRAGQQDE